jgi:hypothetical protein
MFPLLSPITTDFADGLGVSWGKIRVFRQSNLFLSAVGGNALVLICGAMWSIPLFDQVAAASFGSLALGMCAVSD